MVLPRTPPVGATGASDTGPSSIPGLRLDTASNVTGRSVLRQGRDAIQDRSSHGDNTIVTPLANRPYGTPSFVPPSIERPSIPTLYEAGSSWRTGGLQQEGARRHSAEILSDPAGQTAPMAETQPAVSLPTAPTSGMETLVLQALTRLEQGQDKIEKGQKDLRDRVERIESRASQRSSVVARLEESARQAMGSRMSRLSVQDNPEQPSQANVMSNVASTSNAPAGNNRVFSSQDVRNQPTLQSNVRISEHRTTCNRSQRFDHPLEDNRLVYNRDPFNTHPEGSGGNDGNGNPPSHPNRQGNHDEDNRPRRNSSNRENSESVRESVQKPPKLKAQDLGYWDARGKAKDDSKDKPLRVPVEMWINCLERLALSHGDQAVIDNMEPALVHMTSWLGTLSKKELQLTLTLDGWIYLLRRDWGESEVLSRSKAKEYDYTHAEDAMEYWTEKLSLLRQAGYKSESDLYFELWFGLPKSWKENIPMHNTLEFLRTSIRDREAARGRWPSKNSKSDASVRNASVDSGYSLRETTSKKRGGGFAGGGGKRPKDSSSSSRSNDKPIPTCRICEKLGKFNMLHWHRDCPNAEKAKKLNAILEDVEESDESESERDTPKTKESSESGSDVESISRVYSSSTIQAVKENTFVPTCFDTPKVFQSSRNATTQPFGQGNIFKIGGAVSVYIRSDVNGKDFKICCDSGCGPTIGNRSFIQEHFPNAKILLREDVSKLKVTAGFMENRKEYEVLPDYVAVPIYMVTTHGNLLEFQVEIHLSDSAISTGILLGSSALKFNRSLIDFDKEVLISKNSSPNGGRVKVPVYLNEKRRSIEHHPVRAIKDLNIPTGHEGLVSVDLSSLPDHDYLYDGKQWFDRSGFWAKSANGIANNTIAKVIVANFGEKEFKVKRGDIVGYLSDAARNVRVESCSKVNTRRPYMDEPAEGQDFA